MGAVRVQASNWAAIRKYIEDGLDVESMLRRDGQRLGVLVPTAPPSSPKLLLPIDDAASSSAAEPDRDGGETVPVAPPPPAGRGRERDCSPVKAAIHLKTGAAPVPQPRIKSSANFPSADQGETSKADTSLKSAPPLVDGQQALSGTIIWPEDSSAALGSSPGPSTRSRATRTQSAPQLSGSGREETMEPVPHRIATRSLRNKTQSTETRRTSNAVDKPEGQARRRQQRRLRTASSASPPPPQPRAGPSTRSITKPLEAEACVEEAARSESLSGTRRRSPRRRSARAVQPSEGGPLEADPHPDQPEGRGATRDQDSPVHGSPAAPAAPQPLSSPRRSGRKRKATVRALESASSSPQKRATPTRRRRPAETGPGEPLAQEQGSSNEEEGREGPGTKGRKGDETGVDAYSLALPSGPLPSERRRGEGSGPCLEAATASSKLMDRTGPASGGIPTRTSRRSAKAIAQRRIALAAAHASSPGDTTASLDSARDGGTTSITPAIDASAASNATKGPLTTTVTRAASAPEDGRGTTLSQAAKRRVSLKKFPSTGAASGALPLFPTKTTSRASSSDGGLVSSASTHAATLQPRRPGAQRQLSMGPGSGADVAGNTPRLAKRPRREQSTEETPAREVTAGGLGGSQKDGSRLARKDTGGNSSIRTRLKANRNKGRFVAPAGHRTTVPTSVAAGTAANRRPVNPASEALPPHPSRTAARKSIDVYNFIDTPDDKKVASRTKLGGATKPYQRSPKKGTWSVLLARPLPFMLRVYFIALVRTPAHTLAHTNSYKPALLSCEFPAITPCNLSSGR